MNCVICNQELREGISYCTKCGSKVGEVKKELNQEIALDKKWEKLTEHLESILQEETEKYQTQIKELNAQINDKNQSITNLQSETMHQKSELEELKKEIDNLKVQLTTAHERAVPEETKEGYCPECSNEVMPDVHFCNQCGTRIK
jgi:Uncharacterized protein involved in chromosome partitioning